MNFGGQLRRIRFQQGIGISELADRLGISCEQIENWEKERSLPDIYALPRIASALGIMIDDLYDFSDDEFMERVREAAKNAQSLSDVAFRRNTDFLEAKMARDPLNVPARIMYAQLYNHRIRADRNGVVSHMKEALDISPDDQSAWAAFIYASGGRYGDEWLDDRNDFLDYLREFLKNNPGNQQATRLIVENLLAEGQADEAANYVSDFLLFPGNEFRLYIYNGDIALIRGERRTAMQEWENAIHFYPLSWRAHSEFALRLNRLGLYNRALKEYDRAYELQNSPRSTDPLTSRARILEKTGYLEEAAEEHRRIIRELAENFGVTSGETVNEHLHAIARIAARRAFADK